MAARARTVCKGLKKEYVWFVRGSISRRAREGRLPTLGEMGRYGMDGNIYVLGKGLEEGYIFFMLSLLFGTL